MWSVRVDQYGWQAACLRTRGKVCCRGVNSYWSSAEGAWPVTLYTVLPALGSTMGTQPIHHHWHLVIETLEIRQQHRVWHSDRVDKRWCHTADYVYSVGHSNIRCPEWFPRCSARPPFLGGFTKITWLNVLRNKWRRVARPPPLETHFYLICGCSLTVWSISCFNSLLSVGAVSFTL